LGAVQAKTKNEIMRTKTWRMILILSSKITY